MLCKKHLDSVGHLNALLSDLTELVLIQREKNRKKLLAACSNCLTHATELLTDKTLPSKAKYVVAFKKDLKRTSNTLEGICSGLEEQELELYRLREIVQQMDTDLSAHSRAMERELSDIELEVTSADRQLKNREFESQFQKLLQEVKRKERTTDPVIKQQNVEKELQQQKIDQVKLEKYGKYSTKLPAKISGAFDLVTVPIIPLFKDYTLMSSRTLSKIDLDHTKLYDSFLVFNKQHLLVFSNRVADQFVNDRKNIRKNKLKPVLGVKEAKRTNIFTQYVNHLLELINERSSIEYVLMTDIYQSSGTNPDLLYAWIIPSKTLEQMRKLSRTVEVTSWGFPWKVGIVD